MKWMAGAALAMMPALAGCAEAETQRAEDAVSRVVVQDRFAVRRSAVGFDATLSRLLEALDRRDLTVFAVIDHAAAAQGAGAVLPPTTVVIFGNPQAGTPLMRAAPVMGAELPLRALVYERGGEVFLAVTGMANLARAYPLDDEAAVVDRVAGALAEIADEVTAP